jgi:hypothetical protein
MKEQLIRFVMWITGHDRKTVIQLYKDWITERSKK